jgi:lysophospholipase L1-like esterase
MPIHPLRSLLIAITTLHAIIPAAHAADGPTPFPSAKDESAWAGVGPIRVHEWMPRNRDHFWSQREKDQGAVVFVGSSMMGNWKGLPAAFPGLKVANRGIGGDVTRGLLFRFKEDVLDLNPRAVVMSIGSNDLSAHGAPAGIVANIGAIIDQARAYNPKLPIIICTVPPRDVANAPVKPGAHADTNVHIKALGAEKNVFVLDLYPPFSNADGTLIPEYYVKDRIHFTPAGYAKLASVIRPALIKVGITVQ